MRKLAPGLYVDAHNHAHVMIPELLDHFGYADTPENRDVCTKAAVEVCQRVFPGIKAQVVDE